ncbi:collagenase [Massilia sp. CCM 8733]|uniref:Collagenase n=1 Tax=Massilia mucilaginosa TaxID=2609282 RepID=A0ABX0NS52_9BURK|nr:collagenase [Massilia mucilaginosa]NHZ89599.1 collagenase [Massilia mucilaginosa]
MYSRPLTAFYAATLMFAANASSFAFGTPPHATASVDAVLSRTWRCGPSVTLRSQALTREFETRACTSLSGVEQRFHRMFATIGKSVSNDFNESLRANIYRSKAEYEKYAGLHFDIPTDNGGMYLEGFPERPGNQAEFIANQKADGSIHNLEHEFVHFLDARFNLHGDFCRNLHDSHSPPENCPKPAPATPYLVWWTEGIAEYLARGAAHPEAMRIAKTNAFKLSALFDTGYENNTGKDRVYAWSYLAVRFMMENKRQEIERMLAFTRVGDYPRYQAVTREWGDSYDKEFEDWLITVSSELKSGANGNKVTAK